MKCTNSEPMTSRTNCPVSYKRDRVRSAVIAVMGRYFASAEEGGMRSEERRDVSSNVALQGIEHRFQKLRWYLHEAL